MKRIRKRVRFMLCMAVILFAMTTAVMGCYVSNGNGDKVDLNNGMTVEARIQYKEVTYFDYVMQKIGFKAA